MTWMGSLTVAVRQTVNATIADQQFKDSVATVMGMRHFVGERSKKLSKVVCLQPGMATAYVAFSCRIFVFI